MGTFSKVLMAALIAGSGFMLSACNTVEGVGEDVSGAARTTEDAVFGDDVDDDDFRHEDGYY